MGYTIAEQRPEDTGEITDDLLDGKEILLNRIYQNVPRVQWNSDLDAIEYLGRIVKHEKLLKPETRKTVRGVLANLCAESLARYDYNMGKEMGLAEIGLSALRPMFSREMACDLMSQWTRDLAKRIESSI